MIKNTRIIRKETYKIIKDFVKGFARNSIGMPASAKKSIQREAFSVIDTYFPLNTEEAKEKNANINQDLKQFYQDLEAKDAPEKVDKYMCINGYLVQHGEEMHFPKQRCDHCSKYGAYDVPEENHEVRFCAKYDPIGKRIKNLEELSRSD